MVIIIFFTVLKILGNLEGKLSLDYGMNTVRRLAKKLDSQAFSDVIRKTKYSAAKIHADYMT